MPLQTCPVTIGELLWQQWNCGLWRHDQGSAHAGKFIATTLGAGAAEDAFLFGFNSELLMQHGFTPEVLEAAMPEVLERATKVLGEKLLKGEMTF